MQAMLFLPTVLALEILPVTSRPEAAYEIFKGFDLSAWGEPSTPHPTLKRHSESTTREDFIIFLNEARKANVFRERTTEVPSPRISTLGVEEVQNLTTTEKEEKFSCPEEEVPSNIGPYEVPTQRDLVLLTRKTLQRMFGSYHAKVTLFLEDIKKVLRATSQVEKNCAGNKAMYRKCVRHVSNKCETITKSLTNSLELQRQDLHAFGQKDMCTLESMKEDPVKLIKTLASEEASLEFALPSYLRLLNACSVYCLSIVTDEKYKAVKPTRHLTDTDVVVRHFLTPKNYKRLMKRKVAKKKEN